MLSKKVTQILQIGMQKDRVLPIVAESLQIAKDRAEHCKFYVNFNFTKTSISYNVVSYYVLRN